MIQDATDYKILQSQAERRGISNQHVAAQATETRNLRATQYIPLILLPVPAPYFEEIHQHVLLELSCHH
jgi:hypothetical protein